MPFPVIFFETAEELAQTQDYLKAALALMGAEPFQGPGRDYNGFPEILFRATNLGEYLKKSESASILLFKEISKHPDAQYVYSNFNSAMTFSSFITSNMLTSTMLSRYQDNPEFRKILAYYLLKSATNAYNATALYYKEDHSPDSIHRCHEVLCFVYSLLNVCEFLCPEAIEQDPYLEKTHRILLENFIEAKKELQPQDTMLEPEDLNFLIEQKNTIAKQMNRETLASVIYTPEIKWAQRLNPSALAELLQIIQELRTGSKSRQQVALYLSHAAGHAIVLDISMNPDKEKLEIIALESTNNWQFMDVLQKITDALTEAHIKHDIIACQTNLQKDGMSCTAYVLCFMSLLAKTSFHELSQKAELFRTQPECLVSSQLGLRSLPTIPHVRWLDVTAFGKKAVMMGQSFAQMRSDLQRLFPSLASKELEKMMSELKRRYDIDGKEICSYIDYKRRQFKAIALEQPFKYISWETIAKKLTGPSQIAPTQEVALRRLAAGFGPVQELEYMISSMQGLSLSCPDSGENGYTPLHHAVKNSKEKRTFLLLNAGADPDIADRTAEQKTARQYATELDGPQSSYIKTRLSQ